MCFVLKFPWVLNYLNFALNSYYWNAHANGFVLLGARGYWHSGFFRSWVADYVEILVIIIFSARDRAPKIMKKLSESVHLS